jgi:hypothetical protein
MKNKQTAIQWLENQIKLIKAGNHYDLYYRIAEDNLIIGFASTDNTFENKLSFKNCEEIQKQLPNQTKWDVEIEMICPHPQDTYRCGLEYGCDEDGCNHPNQVPYLDADGCLILKIINL